MTPEEKATESVWARLRRRLLGGLTSLLWGTNTARDGQDRPMSKEEIIRRQYEALADFRALPPEVQFRRMQEWGTIDAQGNVLLNAPWLEKEDEAEGQPPPASDPRPPT